MRHEIIGIYFVWLATWMDKFVTIAFGQLFRRAVLVYIFASALVFNADNSIAGEVDTNTRMTTISADTAVGRVSWKIELADSNASRQTGLMNRQKMAAKSGMLFDFSRSKGVHMWMKNTYIPLDMVFIRNDGVVSSVANNTVPHSLQVISSLEPVRYVLEINAGEAEKFGLKSGVALSHPWFASR